jgi:hypothetical protein
MIDVVKPTCAVDGCRTSPSAKFDGYCFTCFVRLFPDKPVVRAYLVKQRIIENKIAHWFQDKPYGAPHFDRRSLFQAST